ncbi:unnamed protein product [Heligmosomoides polygyrus]|uniref:Transposase n=1 Tax=Heligmosomoides polygyrus TaxID=6339 RepID=A0A183FLC3_HELPZ|nr:unnamed protein product [Heligmosomoides polygyrus]
MAKLGRPRNALRRHPLDESRYDWTPRDVKRTPGRPPTRWSNFFVKALNDRYSLFVSLERGGSIGALWHATGTNGDAAGPARESR